MDELNPNNPFFGAFALVEWANCSLEAIGVHIQEFRAENPYERIMDYNENTKWYSHKIRLTHPLPLDVQLCAFDAVNAQRAALDYAMHASAVALGNADPTRTKFPFGKDLKDAEKDAKGQIHNDPIILAKALSFKPYFNGGDPILSGLQRVRNLKHHRFLVPVLTAMTGQKISHGTFYGMAMRNDWDASKNELTFMMTDTPAQFDYNFAFDVFFANSSAFWPAPGLDDTRLS